MRFAPHKTGTNFNTKNEIFERDGYLFVPNLVEDIESFNEKPPMNDKGIGATGLVKFHPKRSDKFTYEPVDDQAPLSFCRYNSPIYKELHYKIRKKLEEILEIDLLPTYYYDRFYYVGQDLSRHHDRPACEVSVTLQIATNSNKPWSIWFETPLKNERFVNMDNGGGVIYKGCEREHWRGPLQSKYNKVQRFIRKLMKKPDDTWHHQIFFHYVRASGPYVHMAYDRG